MSLADLPGQDAAITAGRAQATVEELEAELEARRAQAAQAAERAAEAAARVERDRREARRAGKAQVAALGLELTEALQAPEGERPPISLRGPARTFLYGGPPRESLYGDDPVDPSFQVEALAAHDPVLARRVALHRQAGACLVHLAQVAGLAPGDELFDLADDVECACWRALMARVRVLAGEEA